MPGPTEKRLCATLARKVGRATNTSTGYFRIRYRGKMLFLILVRVHDLHFTRLTQISRQIYPIRILLSRDGSRKRGGGNDTLSPVELKLSSSQKVTVMRECGSHRCLHLSDLGSPDIGRGKKNEAK